MQIELCICGWAGVSFDQHHEDTKFDDLVHAETSILMEVARLQPDFPSVEKFLENYTREARRQAGKSGWTHPEKDYDHWNREYSNGDTAEITKVYDDDKFAGTRSLSHVAWMYCDSAGLAVAAGTTDVLQQAKDRCDQENEVYN